MKQKYFIVGLGCLLLLGGAATCVVVLSSPRTPGPRSHGISASLVGYTNVAVGMPAATYASTNPTTGRFAILRVRTPARRDFFCYFGPIVLRPADGSTPDAIQSRKSQDGDFDLPPHGSAIIAVPEPQIAGKWQSVVVLCHRRSFPAGSGRRSSWCIKSVCTLFSSISMVATDTGLLSLQRLHDDYATQQAPCSEAHNAALVACWPSPARAR